eukprot:PhM_4_TR18060/c0_g1_i2/m.101775
MSLEPSNSFTVVSSVASPKLFAPTRQPNQNMSSFSASPSSSSSSFEADHANTATNNNNNIVRSNSGARRLTVEDAMRSMSFGKADCRSMGSYESSSQAFGGARELQSSGTSFAPISTFPTTSADDNATGNRHRRRQRRDGNSGEEEGEEEGEHNVKSRQHNSQHDLLSSGSVAEIDQHLTSPQEDDGDNNNNKNDFFRDVSGEATEFDPECDQIQPDVACDSIVFQLNSQATQEFVPAAHQQTAPMTPQREKEEEQQEQEEHHEQFIFPLHHQSSADNSVTTASRSSKEASSSTSDTNKSHSKLTITSDTDMELSRTALPGGSSARPHITTPDPTTQTETEKEQEKEENSGIITSNAPLVSTISIAAPLPASAVSLLALSDMESSKKSMPPLGVLASSQPPPPSSPPKREPAPAPTTYPIFRRVFAVLSPIVSSARLHRVYQANIGKSFTSIPCDSIIMRWWYSLVLLTSLFSFLVCTATIVSYYNKDEDKIADLFTGDVAMRTLSSVIFAMDFYLHRRYVTGARIPLLWLDVIPALPFHFLTFAVPSSRAARIVICILPALKMFRIPTMFQTSSPCAIDIPYVRFYYRLYPTFRVIFWFCVTVHILVSIQLFASKNKRSYADAFRYVWVILSTSPIGAEPENLTERVFTGVLMTISLFLQGYIGGAISFYVFSFSVENENRAQMIQTLEVLRFYNLPRDVQCEVLSYQHHLLENNSARSTNAKVLESLPETLIGTIQMYVKVDILARAKFLQDAPKECIMSLADAMRQFVSEPENNIIVAGEVGYAMYFMYHGMADVILPNGVCVACIRRGDFFGEIALLSADSLRKATVRSLTYCDILELHRDDFDEIIDGFPEFLDTIMEKRLASAATPAPAPAAPTSPKSVSTAHPHDESSSHSTPADDPSMIDDYFSSDAESVKSRHSTAMSSPCSILTQSKVLQKSTFSTHSKVSLAAQDGVVEADDQEQQQGPRVLSVNPASRLKVAALEVIKRRKHDDVLTRGKSTPTLRQQQKQQHQRKSIMGSSRLSYGGPTSTSGAIAARRRTTILSKSAGHPLDENEEEEGRFTPECLQYLSHPNLQQHQQQSGLLAKSRKEERGTLWDKVRRNVALKSRKSVFAPNSPISVGEHFAIPAIITSGTNGNETSTSFGHRPHQSNSTLSPFNPGLGASSFQQHQQQQHNGTMPMNTRLSVASGGGAAGGGSGFSESSTRFPRPRLASSVGVLSPVDSSVVNKSQFSPVPTSSSASSSRTSLTSGAAASNRRATHFAGQPHPQSVTSLTSTTEGMPSFTSPTTTTTSGSRAQRAARSASYTGSTSSGIGGGFGELTFSVIEPCHDELKESLRPLRPAMPRKPSQQHHRESIGSVSVTSPEIMTADDDEDEFTEEELIRLDAIEAALMKLWELTQTWEILPSDLNDSSGGGAGVLSPKSPFVGAGFTFGSTTIDDMLPEVSFLS